MKIRIVSTFLVASAVTAWAAACSVEQARPVCLVGHGPYVAKYTLKSTSGTGTCSERKGELLGIEKYNRPPTAQDPNPTQTVAIKPETLLGLAPPPSGGQAQSDIIALGQLASGDPDSDNFCTAATFSTVHQPDPDNGDQDVSYAFSNVKFYVTPRIPGTQFTAELSYKEGDCSATYDVTAVFPAVGCNDGHD
jgi:hypothetical protein